MRYFNRSGIAVLAASLLVFNACGSSSSSTPPTQPKAGSHSGSWLLETNVIVLNKSDRCAWVTVYWSLPLLPWEIASDPASRPRFVTANTGYDFAPIAIPQTGVLPIPGQIKVLAEVTGAGGCNSGVVATPSDDAHALLPTPNENASVMFVCTNIVGSNGSYSVSTPKSVAERSDCPEH